MQAIWQQPELILHSMRLYRSFQHWTGKPLIETKGADEEIARSLFEASFILVSHGMEADPILNYGNLAALDLWQMDWAQFTSTPSRHTAEPVAREERERLLRQAQTHGYISNYNGIRISSTRKRFEIKSAIVWNVLDEEDRKCGQAATFSEWNYI
ncbi:MEKHLA domain-containing protein [Pseudanabaena sp. PCC 6802]|uniref:MEKHLA domain-containing protein n=1 Tax=Pseudanabaena sp. PCC 6802 TaxID=118173 RepID=UPI00034A181D|nr:MEKHLA domain-containing protein [Pseudanabaena sp. PCC 6802]